MAGRACYGSRQSRLLRTIQDQGVSAEALGNVLLKVTWALALNWKSLELICGRPVHHGFSLNEKADAVATLAENLTTLWVTESRPKGTRS